METVIELKKPAKYHIKDCCNVEFLQGMVNRCIVGIHRYGPFHRIGWTTSSFLPPIFRLKQCLKKFDRTGNKELLLDIANYAMAEYTRPHHPKAHFKSLDQGGRRRD